MERCLYRIPVLAHIYETLNDYEQVYRSTVTLKGKADMLEEI